MASDQNGAQVTADAGDGPVLGEEARADILGVLVPLYYSEWDDGEEVGKAADDILTALNKSGGPVADLLVQARAFGADERDRLLRVYHREPMSQDCRDGIHFGGCFGCRCICHGRPL